MVGLFINALPVRLRVQPSESVAAFLARVHRVLLDIRDFEYAPLQKIREWAGLRARVQLFDTLFVFENYPVDAAFARHARDRRVSDVRSFERNNIPLNVFALPGDPVAFNFLYHSGSFHPRDIGALASSYGRLLEQVACDPSIPVGRLVLLDGAQAKARLNGSCAPSCGSLTPVCQAFEQEARRHPRSVAIVDGTRAVSYAELDRLANALSGVLRRRGIGSESRVAIVARRTIEAITAVLATLKTGAAYVPIEADQPAGRMSAMLREAAPHLIFTSCEDANHALPPDTPVLRLSEAPAEQPDGASSSAPHLRSLSYIVFTSGSSGAPKGVMVEQRSIAAASRAWIADYELSPEDRHLQMASFSFDVFAGDWVRALSSGGSLVLCPKEILVDAPRLFKLIAETRVTVAEFVPAVLISLLDYIQAHGLTLPPLRLLISGSDVLQGDQLQRLRKFVDPETRIINSYGLAETTVDTTWAELDSDLEASDPVPIGRPFPGQSAYVLDNCLRLLPEGVAGQLYIGGSGVARGYLNRAAATAARFLPDPFSSLPGATMYSTGDRVRINVSGQIEYLGRADAQIKIRGIRIEPAEVEAALRSHPAVKDAAVIAAPDGDEGISLTAYVAAEPAADLPVKIRQHALSLLPPAAVPTRLIIRERLPLTPNGKIDRRTLPDLPRETAAALEPLETPTEMLLAETWHDLLRTGRLGQSSHFFELGGHSLMAARLISRVREAFGVEMNLRDIFIHPTLREFADALDRATLEQADPGLLRHAVAATLAEAL